IVSRFYREVRAASQLSHPNIITAFDAGQAGPTHYFAMEYVQGIDLAQLVKQAGPLSIAQACDYIRQAALGLQHAYQRGLVHRDIKPSNLLVTGIVDRGALVARKDQPPLSTHVVKILDMGLARMADNDDSIGTLTEEGSVLGTLDYLSPEQAMNAHQADIRSDLYSLGCTFYFLLTGQAAHGGGTATEKLLRHRLEEPELVERLRPEVPAAVAAVVRKLMAKQPEDRYQTPAELAAALAGGPNRIQVPASPAGGRAIAPLRLPSVPTAGNGPDTDPTEVQPTSLGSARRSAAGKFLWVGGGLALTLGACLLGALLLLNRKEEKAAQPGMATASGPATALRYVKKATRDETVLATLQGNGLPTLAGTWYGIGYFEALGGVEAVHPFEKQ